jgi:hypothetical protein
VKRLALVYDSASVATADFLFCQTKMSNNQELHEVKAAIAAIQPEITKAEEKVVKAKEQLQKAEGDSDIQRYSVLLQSATAELTSLRQEKFLLMEKENRLTPQATNNVMPSDETLAAQNTIINAMRSMAKAEELVDEQTATSYLKFQSFKFADDRTYEKLVIRNCYDEILMKTGISTATVKEEGTELGFMPGKLLSVIGTPGIGKSMMLLYAVYLFHGLGATVYYCHHKVPDIYFMLVPESAEVKMVKGVIEEANSVVLYDSVKALATGSVVITASSPRSVECINEFKKAGGHQKAYMPTWSGTEFKNLLSICLPSKVTDKRLMERFLAFGGVPRNVLKSTVMSIDEELTELVKMVKSPKELLKFSGTSFSDLPVTFHDLVHMVPSDDYLKFSYHPASKKVTMKVFDGAKNDTIVDLAAAIRYCRQNHATVFAGDVFEKYAIEMLRNGGKFKRKNLKTAFVDEVEIKPRKLNLSRGYEEISTVDAEFHVSTRSNETAVDFIVKDRMMNATISTKHDFKITPSNVQWLSKLDLCAAGSKGYVDWSICFVVPDDILDSYTEQKVISCLDPIPGNLRGSKRSRTDESQKKREKHQETNDLIAKVHKHVEGLEQYAIGIPLVDRDQTLTSSSTTAVEKQMGNMDIDD